MYLMGEIRDSFDYQDNHQMEILCNNLEKVITAKDEEINRINRQCEYLMTLYYESEEALATRGVEITKLRAKLESCTCQKVDLYKPNNVEREQLPVRNSIDSKLTRNSGQWTKWSSDEHQRNNEMTSKSLSFLESDHDVQGVVDGPYMQRNSLTESVLFDQADLAKPQSTPRKSLSTAGWSDFSQFIDDSPLLNISTDFVSPNGRPISVAMSDHVTSSRADVLVLDHYSAYGGVISDDEVSEDEEESTLHETESRATDDITDIDNDKMDDDDANTEENLRTEENRKMSIDARRKRNIMINQHGIRVATTKMKHSPSDDSGFDENPYVSGKKLKPRGLSYTFEILPSKNSKHLPITSKNIRRSTNTGQDTGNKNELMKYSNRTTTENTKDKMSSFKTLNEVKYALEYKAVNDNEAKSHMSFKTTTVTKEELEEAIKASLHNKTELQQIINQECNSKGHDLAENVQAKHGDVDICEDKATTTGAHHTYTKEELERDLKQLTKYERFPNQETTPEFEVNNNDEKYHLDVRVAEIFRENCRRNLIKQNNEENESETTERVGESNKFRGAQQRKVNNTIHSLRKDSRIPVSKSLNMKAMKLNCNKKKVEIPDTDRRPSTGDSSVNSKQRSQNSAPETCNSRKYQVLYDEYHQYSLQPNAETRDVHYSLTPSQPPNTMMRSWDIQAPAKQNGGVKAMRNMSYSVNYQNDSLTTALTSSSQAEEVMKMKFVGHTEAVSDVIDDTKQKVTAGFHSPTGIIYAPHAPEGAKKCSTPNTSRKYVPNNNVSEMAKTWTLLFS